MSRFHLIRLNRAWELRTLSRADWKDADWDALAAETDARLRIDLPWNAAADLCEDDTPLLITRHFNRPSNLQAGHAVHLAVLPVEIAARVFINEISVEPATRDMDGGGPIRFAIERYLRNHNRLHILAPMPDSLARAAVVLIVEEPPAA